MDTFVMLSWMTTSQLMKDFLYSLAQLVRTRSILCFWRRLLRRFVAVMRKSLRMWMIYWK